MSKNKVFHKEHFVLILHDKSISCRQKQDDAAHKK